MIKEIPDYSDQVTKHNNSHYIKLQFLNLFLHRGDFKGDFGKTLILFKNEKR